MKTEKYACVCICLGCILSFILGACNQFISAPVLAVFHPFLVGAVAGGVYGLYFYLRNRARKQHKDSYEALLGRTLTRKSSEGYTLDAGDLYEAIDKLGYIEHDMKGGL